VVQWEMIFGGRFTVPVGFFNKIFFFYEKATFDVKSEVVFSLKNLILMRKGG